MDRNDRFLLIICIIMILAVALFSIISCIDELEIKEKCGEYKDTCNYYACKISLDLIFESESSYLDKYKTCLDKENAIKDFKKEYKS